MQDAVYTPHKPCPTEKEMSPHRDRSSNMVVQWKTRMEQRIHQTGNHNVEEKSYWKTWRIDLETLPIIWLASLITSWVDITWSNRLTGLTMRPKRDLTGCTSPGPDWLEGVSCLFPPWMMVEGADKQSRTEVTELAWWCKTKMNMFIEQFDYFTILQDFTFNCYANSIY